MEQLLTNRLPLEICETQRNLASKEKVSHCQRFHSRQAVNHESTVSFILQCMSDRPDAQKMSK